MRVDKLTLAALEATLTGPPPPVALALATAPDALFSRATRIAEKLAAGGVDALAQRTTATVGGGGAPGVPLASAAVSLPPDLAAALRQHTPAVVGRVDHDRLLLDLIAVDPELDAALATAAQHVHKAC
jgi:L-seryl-tRNA(Ser) seleniumtransferase